MDRDLFGTLLLGGVCLPYAVEVLWQMRLLARFLSTIPAPARAALPAHPQNTWLAPAGSIRFFLALWRSVRRDLPDDPPLVARLKGQMRASIRREIVWGAGFTALAVALLARGWRPIWP